MPIARPSRVTTESAVEAGRLRRARPTVNLGTIAGGERIYRRGATSGGDAKTVRHAGVPTVEFGFGTDTVHGVDEYNTRASLARNAEVYTRLPDAWADLLDDAS